MLYLMLYWIYNVIYDTFPSCGMAVGLCRVASSHNRSAAFLDERPSVRGVPHVDLTCLPVYYSHEEGSLFFGISRLLVYFSHILVEFTNCFVGTRCWAVSLLSLSKLCFLCLWKGITSVSSFNHSLIHSLYFLVCGFVFFKYCFCLFTYHRNVRILNGFQWLIEFNNNNFQNRLC